MKVLPQLLALRMGYVNALPQLLVLRMGFGISFY